MEDQAAITPRKVRDKLFKKYEDTVRGAEATLHHSGADAFHEILDLTVLKDGTGIEEGWSRDHGFLYEVTERLALRALRYAKKEKPSDVKRRHVVKAANCLIPDISRYCMRSQVPAESRFETRGPYCREWIDMEEN